MKLSVKLAASFSIMLLLICGLALFSIREMSGINAATNNLTKNWLPSIEAIGKVNSLTSFLRRVELVHILTTSESEMRRYEEQLTALTSELDAAMRDCETRITEPEQREIYPRFAADWKEFMALHGKTVDLSRRHEKAAAAEIASGKAAQLVQDAQKNLNQLIEINERGIASSAAATQAAYDAATTTIIGALFGAIAVGALLTVLLVRNVLGQLGEDPGYLRQISGQVAAGDLDVRFKPVKGQGGVYGVLVRMVENMKAKIAEAAQKSEEAAKEAQAAKEATRLADEAALRAERAKAEGMLQAADQLEGVVLVVTSASEQLSAQVEQSSRGSEQQSHRVSETATAMEQMNATVLEVARNATQAAETSARAKLKAVEGADVVDQVVRFMDQVKTNARQSRTDMETLGKQAEGIGQVLNVITDIADQTNLLALNAAIEAARAGDAGRGFAVVADEVRKLAEKTMTATKQVGDAILGIQQGTRRNFDSVAQAVAAIEEATTLAGSSGQALKEIVSLVDLTADQVRSIATASEQQSAASEEINRSLDDVNRISTETAQAMRQSAYAVSDLANQSQVLKSMIDSMKFDGGATALRA